MSNDVNIGRQGKDTKYKGKIETSTVKMEHEVINDRPLAEKALGSVDREAERERGRR